ncbi:MAG: hypothetical protein IPK08_19325 [Bacteroidetes bacterium]|nr:hypothetical protein [Bacteroidota bacterium]
MNSNDFKLYDEIKSQNGRFEGWNSVLKVYSSLKKQMDDLKRIGKDIFTEADVLA